MRRSHVSLIFGSLFLAVMLIYKLVDDSTSSALIKNILQGHNVPRSPDALAETVVEAKRVGYHYFNSGDKPPRRVEQYLKVCFKQNAFKREKRNSQGLLMQVDLYGEQAAYRLKSNPDNATSFTEQLEDWQSSGLRLNVMTFGLTPLLRQLQQSNVEAVRLKSDEGGLEKLELKFDSVVCTLYVDQQYLIRKLEMIHRGHLRVIEYEDYELVEGIQLPLKQRVFVDGLPVDELYFTKYDFNPSFPEDYFSPDAMK